VGVRVGREIVEPIGRHGAWAPCRGSPGGDPLDHPQNYPESTPTDPPIAPTSSSMTGLEGRRRVPGGRAGFSGGATASYGAGLATYTGPAGLARGQRSSLLTSITHPAFPRPQRGGSG